jgi:CPA2 family monovalent cation:H+ antiporter-2
MLARRASDRLARHAHAEQAPGAEVLQIEDHVVIGGFGRVGRTIADLLDAENVPFVALDGNSALVGEERKRGRPVYFGDASRSEMLERAGARRARAFVVTLDEPKTAEHMVRAIRELRTDAPIYARAKDAAHAARLAALGCIEVIPEATEASLQLGARVLGCVGLPEDAVLQRVDAAREQEAAKLQAASAQAE